MFAGHPFAAAAFAQLLPIYMDAQANGQGLTTAALSAGEVKKASFSAAGATHLAAKGQTIIESGVYDASTSEMEAFTYWHMDVRAWAVGYAAASFSGAADAGDSFVAHGTTAADMNAGYTLPFAFSANAGSAMLVPAQSVIETKWDWLGSSSVTFVGMQLRQASMRADGAGGFTGITGKKLGVAMLADGRASFKVIGVIPGEDEGDMDAPGRAYAVFEAHYNHDMLLTARSSSAFEAAAAAMQQALFKAQAAATASMRGHAYGNAYASAEGFALASFRTQYAAFHIANFMAAGNSWTNFITWPTLGGGAQMAGTSTAVFESTYAAAHMASMKAAGVARTQLDGFRRIFIMSAIRAASESRSSILTAYDAEAAMHTTGRAMSSISGMAVFYSMTQMQGAGHIKFVPGNPIFQYLHAAQDTAIRAQEVRGVERPFELREVSVK